jgi:hypothetical protein
MTVPKPSLEGSPFQVIRLGSIVIGTLLGASIARTEATIRWEWPRDRFRGNEITLETASRVVPFVTIGAAIGAFTGSVVYQVRRPIHKLALMATTIEKLVIVTLLAAVSLVSGVISWFSVPWAPL